MSAGDVAPLAVAVSNDGIPLSTVHITGRSVTSRTARRGAPGQSVWTEGELYEVSQGKLKGRARQGGGKRGQTGTTQSGKSRRNAAELLAQLEQDSVPAFVTLTIPAKFCPPPGGLPPILAKLHKRLKRKHSGFAVFIQREMHRSKLPHFHGLLWLNDGQPLAVQVKGLQKWLRKAWAESLGVKQARVTIEEPRNSQSVRHYVSGYLVRGKGYQKDAGGVNWGKWWYVWAGPGHERLPWSERTETDAPATLATGVAWGEAALKADPSGRFYWRVLRVAKRLGLISRMPRRSARSLRLIIPEPSKLEAMRRVGEYFAALSAAELASVQIRPSPERAGELAPDGRRGSRSIR